MAAHQKNQSSSTNATPPPMGYVNREDARNLEAGTADCMLVMREHTGRFERPVYSKPEQADVGEIGFGAVVPTASERAGRIYVAGPMSGIADFNFPVFNAAAAMLRYSGWTVENPAEHALADNLEWADYMAYDLTRLGLCGAIYLLPGWSKSRGANIEKNLAAELGMDIRFDPSAEQGSDRVEVVGYEHVTFTGLQVVTDKDHPPVIPGSKWKTPVELVAHAHVTRLQAEVSALQQRLNIADQRVCDQQPELTKARNLISTLEARLLHKDQGIDFRDALISEASELAYKELPATWLSRASTLCVRQSAPAARVCSHIWVSADNRGVGAGEICQACSEHRPAAKLGASMIGIVHTPPMEYDEP